jgi:hypothetical protein
VPPLSYIEGLSRPSIWVTNSFRSHAAFWTVSNSIVTSWLLWAHVLLSSYMPISFCYSTLMCTSFYHGRYPSLLWLVSVSPSALSAVCLPSCRLSVGSVWGLFALHLCSAGYHNWSLENLKRKQQSLSSFLAWPRQCFYISCCAFLCINNVLSTRNKIFYCLLITVYL